MLCLISWPFPVNFIVLDIEILFITPIYVLTHAFVAQKSHAVCLLNSLKCFLQSYDMHASNLFPNTSTVFINYSFLMCEVIKEVLFFPTDIYPFLYGLAVLVSNTIKLLNIV